MTHLTPIITAITNPITKLLAYLSFGKQASIIVEAENLSHNTKKEKHMALIDYENVTDGEMILRFSLGFIESIITDELHKDLDFSELKELVKEKVSEFIDDVSNTFDGNMDNKVLYMKLDNYYGELSADNFDQVSGFSFDDLEYTDYKDLLKIAIFVRLTKVYDSDDVDTLCLSITGYGNFGVSVVNYNRLLVYQGYCDGEYDTGFYSHGEDGYVDKGLEVFNYAQDKLLESTDEKTSRVITNLDDYKKAYPDNYFGESWEEFEKLLSTFRMFDADRIDIQHSKTTVCTITLDGKAIFGFRKSGFTSLVFRGYPLSKDALDAICQDIHKMGFETTIVKKGKVVNIKQVKKYKDFIALLSLTLLYINFR